MKTNDNAEELEKCVCCGRSIRDGEAFFPYLEGEVSCEACSPTYQDILTRPSEFVSNEGEPMNFIQARKIADEHIAQGGNLSDKMVIS